MYSYMFIETHDLLLTPLVSRDLGSVDLAGECGASLPDPLQQLLRIYVLVTWRFLEPAKPRWMVTQYTIYTIYIYIHTWMCTSVSSWFMSMVTVHLNMREIQSTVQVGCTSKQGIGVWDGEPGTWWRGHHEIMVMMMLMHLDFRPVFYNDSCFQGLEMNVNSPWAANSWIDACIACIYCMHRCIRTHTHTHTRMDI